MENPPKEELHPIILNKKIKLFISDFSTEIQELIKYGFKSIDKWTAFIVNTRVNITHGEDRENKVSDSFKYLVKTNAVLERLCRYYIFNNILNIDTSESKLEDDLKGALNSIDLWESNIK
ncbi:hypothetical protein FOD82_09645 [Lactobacillus sp. LL6]|nr:HEPN domain-containing protein [Lactobacillus sp. LL6]TSO25478.1 hypothetical protein FOD82_09645 [Lactobacillus sp. LL6]